MTKDQAGREYAELWLTYPMKPYTPDEAIRADETSVRMKLLYKYAYNNGPEPAADWKSSAPQPTAEEKAELSERRWQHFAHGGLISEDTRADNA